MKTPLYYEAHLTLEPVFTEGELEGLRRTCTAREFRLADLFMKKSRSSTPERSDRDTFCTGRGDEYDELLERMQGLGSDLHRAGFKVWRMKIEAVIYDESFLL